MQRLKKAAWHLRRIQHVAILLVVGPANKHRPRRVVLITVLRRIFRTLRGFCGNGQGNCNLFRIFGSDHRGRFLCRALDGLRRQARLFAGLRRRPLHDRGSRVSSSRSRDRRNHSSFCAIADGKPLRTFPGIAAQPKISRPIRPSVPTTIRHIANSVKPRRETKSSSLRTTKRPATKAAAKPTPITTRSSEDSASRFL